MRPRRDADDAVADLGDLLPGLDVLADPHEVRAGMAVIDLETGQGA
jgi:hypothetical protein